MSSELTRLQPLNVLNLREHITLRIREAILDGTYRPGGRLVETAIAEQLGVSRAPVREALSALEGEGIVVNAPRRGYSVIDFTDKDIDEIYSLRILLEVGALRRAIGRFSEEGIAKMQSVIDRLGEATYRQSDPGVIISLDLSFHDLIYRAAEHERLYAAWDMIRLQTQMLIGVTSRTHYRHPDQPKQLHQSILDAICDSDLKRAESMVTDHALDAQRRAYEALRTLRSDELR